MSSRALRRTLIGLESTPGSSVTVDVPLRVKTELEAIVEKIQVEEDIGTFAQPRHYLGSSKAEGSLEQDGIYLEAPYLVSMVLGQTTPALSAGKYLWNFNWPEDTAPTFATYTMEYTDGADYVIKSTDVFGTKLNITGEAGKSWVFNVDLVGADVSYPAALSADLSPSGTVTSIRMADTRLWIDSTYASIGTTVASGVFRDFDWSLDNLNHQKLLAGAQYPVGRGNDRYDVELTITLEADDTDTRNLRDRLLADTGVAVRVGATSNNNWARIDGWYMVDSVKSLGEVDGNNVVEITLKGEKDSSDNTGVVHITCDLGAL